MLSFFCVKSFQLWPQTKLRKDSLAWSWSWLVAVQTGRGWSGHQQWNDATYLSELLKTYMANKNLIQYWELLTLTSSVLLFQIQIWPAFQEQRVIKFLYLTMNQKCVQKILPSAMLKLDFLLRNILKKIYSVISFAGELGMRKENRFPYCFCLRQNFSEYNLKKQKKINGSPVTSEPAAQLCAGLFGSSLLFGTRGTEQDTFAAS